MNFVNEEDFVLFEIRQNPREISGLLKHWASRRTHRGSKFISDNVSQRRLTETGWTIQQHMVHRLLPFTCRFNRHFEVFTKPVLSNVTIQRIGPETSFVGRLVIRAHRTHDSRVSHGAEMVLVISGQVHVALAAKGPRKLNHQSH